MRYRIAVLAVFWALGGTFAGCVGDAAEEPMGLEQASVRPDATPPTLDAIPSESGCTQTPGYWKTHSACGKVDLRDVTWDDLLPNAENTKFFNSGYTVCQVLWVSPKGNAYYILAPAFVAAKLNQLAGADFSDAMEAFVAAGTLFEQFTPDEVALMRGGAMIPARFISLAETLDAYNNGLIGPGHCDDG